MPEDLISVLSDIRTVDDMVEAFSDEARCRQLLEAMVWPNGRICPACGYKHSIAIAGRDKGGYRARPGLYQCSSGDCRFQFNGRKGGRPPYDAVLMFRILIIQAQNNLSDDRAEFLISDRLSFMRFLGLGLSDRVPDARTIRAFRERLTRAKAIDALFTRLDTALREAGYIAMSGQLVDSTPVAAPRQRNTDDEKKDVKAGKATGIRPDAPARARQKDVDARWTVQFGKARVPPDIAIPSFGYKNHAGIDKRFRFIRKRDVTDASRHDGRMLRRGLLDKTNTGSGVRADSACRSKQNEAFLERNGFVSHVHHRKPKGRPMPRHIRRGNNTKSKHRAPVEHVFAVRKHMMGDRRHRPGQDQDRHGHHCLQHPPPGPARRHCHRLITGRVRPEIPETARMAVQTTLSATP